LSSVIAGSLSDSYLGVKEEAEQGIGNKVAAAHFSYSSLTRLTTVSGPDSFSDAKALK